MSCIDGDSEFAWFLSCEKEDCTCKTLSLIVKFSFSEVIDTKCEVSKIAPEFEIPVSSLNNSAFCISKNDRSASLATLNFVEQVHSEEKVEINFEDLTHYLDFLGVSRELETLECESSNSLKP